MGATTLGSESTISEGGFTVPSTGPDLGKVNTNDNVMTAATTNTEPTMTNACQCRLKKFFLLSFVVDW